METHEPRVLADIQSPVAELTLGAWPARSRRLLQELFARSVAWLQPRLGLGVDAYCQHLAGLAEHARHSVDQGAYLSARERLPQRFALLRNAVIQALAESFTHIGTPSDPARTFAHTPSLTLVNPAQLETLATLESMTARGNARGSLALVELGYRLAVLVAKPPLEGADLPLSPHVLGHALYKGSLAMELVDGQELELLRHLEEALQPDLPSFYEHLNQHLRDDGLLPQLRVYSTSWLADDAQDAAEVKLDGKDRTGAHASSVPSPVHGRTDTDNSIQSLLGSSEILATLSRLLAQRNPRPAASPASGPVVSTEELLGVLGAMQRSLAGRRQTPAAPGNAQQLRAQLLGGLQSQGHVGGSASTLGPEHADTLDLVAMLFEQLAKHTRMGGSARSVLTGLQMPILHAALHDRRFFEQDSHPARQLLGAATQVANDWLDVPGSEPDPTLESKLQALVDRANREPPSEALYTALLAEIDAHLQILKRRAQISERRHIEAMQGRERLDRARQCAIDLMSERLSATQPSYVVRALLDHAWTDVLALTVLRHGESSSALTAQLIITDQLLGRLPVDDVALLQGDVETGLSQIGMSATEAEQVARHLVTSHGNSNDASKHAGAPELLAKLKSRQRFGSTPAPQEAASQTQSVVRADLETHLRQLPFGTWFEFADADSNLWQSRKLAWFSSLTGQALFVNQRGQRARETSLSQLAEAIHNGQAREMPLTTDDVMDRAWRALIALLNQTASAAANRQG